MMNKILKSIFILIFSFAFCRYNITGQEKNNEIEIDISGVVIPEGIVYNKAADEINNQAINYIIELVNGYKIYNNPLFVTTKCIKCQKKPYFSLFF